MSEMTVPEDPPAAPGQDYSLYFRALDVGLWDYDIDADTLSCDSRWHAMLQLDPGSIRCVADFRPYIHPDDVDYATAVDLDAVERLIAKDRRYHVDFRITRADGITRRWRSVACLVLSDETQHRRAVGCVTDITDIAATRRRSPKIVAAPDAPDAPVAPSDLTARELECLHWVSIGKTAWETAVIMGRSSRTIEFHLTNAVRKLSASNKIHAVVIAVRAGLI